MSIIVLDEINKIFNDNSKEFAIANLEDLQLDTRNPRFASTTVLENNDTTTEQDVIEYLTQYGKLIDIMNSIIFNNGLYWEEWLSCSPLSSGKLLVLEGNRRISACKALLNINLIPEEFRPLINLSDIKDNEEFRKRISTIRVVKYNSNVDAQNYIAAKHTNPEIKRWETPEQYNYYFIQFHLGTEISEIAKRAHDSTTNIIKYIKKYSLFRSIFDITQKKHPHLLIEGTSILPLVDKFMPLLTGNDKDCGLSLKLDEQTLTYYSSPVCSDIYEKIICLIGEAFFIRPSAKGELALKERNYSSKYRISTEEIKSQKKVKKLITSDIRIPGLKDLISEYRQYLNPNEDSTIAPPCTNITSDTTTSNYPSDTVQQQENNQSPQITTSSQIAVTQEKSQQSNSTQKEYEFFEDLDYSTLNPQDLDDLGLYRVCKEIVKISNYNSNAGYKNFPIASTFLLRSLIEQTLTRQLKKTDHYTRINNNNTNKTKTPELGKMIEYILKQCNSGNYSSLNNDSKLVKLFNQTFTGFGTKDQLDMVIHQPHMIEPEQNFLNALSKQGIKSIIQTIITNLYVENEAD